MELSLHLQWSYMSEKTVVQQPEIINFFFNEYSIQSFSVKFFIPDCQSRSNGSGVNALMHVFCESGLV